MGSHLSEMVCESAHTFAAVGLLVHNGLGRYNLAIPAIGEPLSSLVITTCKLFIHRECSSPYQLQIFVVIYANTGTELFIPSLLHS